MKPSHASEADLAAELDLPDTFTTEVPLLFPVKGAVRFDDQAQLHAVKYLQGLARAVHGDGSFVFEGARALDIQEGSPCVVSLENGSVRARDVIVATNVPFGDHGLYDALCRIHRSYLVAGLVDTAPLDATFISVDEPMRSILTIAIDGKGYVLAGGEGHPASESGDSAERYRRLAGFARDRLGVEEVAYRWSTKDGIPVDGLPYVGLMSPEAKHVYVITGLRKWGPTNGTAAALTLADALTGRENPWAAVFNSNRTAPADSAEKTAGESPEARQPPPSVRNWPPERGRHRGCRRKHGRLQRRSGPCPCRLGRLHASGPHRGVQPRRRHLGLPLPRLPLRHRRQRHSRSRSRCSPPGLYPESALSTSMFFPSK